MTPFRTVEWADDQEIQLFTRSKNVAPSPPTAPQVKSRLGTPASTILLQRLLTQVRTAWAWIEQKRTQQTSMRRLRVSETISLGEKRFVSILQVDGAQYLIGGAAGNVSLLAVLDKDQNLENSVRRQSFSAGEQL